MIHGRSLVAAATSVHRRCAVRVTFGSQYGTANGRYATQASARQEVVIEKLTGDQKGIALLGLNFTATRNALSKSFVGSLRSALTQLDADSDVRVLIVRSLVSGIFCAGADLKERLAMPESEVGPFVDTLRALCTQLDDIRMPTIAALDGAALGGGLELALSCDLRVAAANAKLGLVETKLAIIPGAGGTQRLPRLIGASKAKELIFTGRIIDGIQAHRLGIVNEVVEHNHARDAASTRSLELASEILQQAPVALRMAKVAINKGVQVDLARGLELERHCYAQVIPTKDRIEGLTAFVEKRAPVYKGE